jgi:glutaminase
MQQVDFRSAGLSPKELPVWQYLNELYSRHRPNQSGQLGSYIPELSAVDPDQFALAFATTDGFVYEVGDIGALFTIQSVSKAVIYALALEDHGREEVLRHIGVEPSGEAFNSITFDERNNRPFNPMVNAGAIAASAMIKGADHTERYQRILDIFQRFTGRMLDLDEAVYRSESLTGNRNRAIAYLELNAGMIAGDVDEHLDLYFRQCSLLVTARDLAMIGATLANGGVNPVTRQRAISTDNVRSVLSVMNTCGMYDYAGGWQFSVGLPAKSGVGGGIAAVLPGQLGIGTFSPRLDAVGNSARGVKVCEDISANFRLHLFEDRGGGLVPLRRVYRSDEVHSKRVRRHEQARKLDRYGHLIAIYELQAELGFIEAERVTRRIIEDLDSAYYFVVDLTRVLRIDGVAVTLLNTARRTLQEAGKGFAVVSISGELPHTFEQDMHFPNVDQALEYFEDRLLDQAGSGQTDAAVPLAEFDLLAGLDEAMLAALARRLRPQPFEPGARLIAQNARADELFFLIEGHVDITVRVGNAPSHRVSTVEPGTVFGELALFGHAPRTADVVAVSTGTALVLDRDALDDLAANAPATHNALVMAVGASLAERLRRANAEIRALSR